jgi:hypothetical protein
VAGAALAQTSPYQAEESVELHANGNHWQKCVVTAPGDVNRVMRMQCEPYQGAGYSRGGGMYTETITSKGVRRAGAPAPRLQATQTPTSGGGYTVGQTVKVEASQQWVPCTVSDIQHHGAIPMIRVYCLAYPALSRAEGVYLVHNNEEAIRPATGRIGPAPKPAVPARAQPAPGNSLHVGEYACYGSGGQILGGLKFNITAAGRYTAAYGAAGTYAISGGNVTFRGGAMDGVTVREPKANNSFRVGSQAECEFWG